MLDRSKRFQRLAKTAGRLMIVAVAIGFAIGLFELPALVGLVDYRALFQTRSAPWERSGSRPDTMLLFTREGGRRSRPVLTGNDVHRLSGRPRPTLYQCDVRYDRDGFRNPRDLDAADVVVLGDSLIEGFHINEREIVTARLAERTGLAVANLARGGDGPRQEFEILKRYGLRLRPKVCIWAFYEGNDLADEAEYKANQERVEAWTRRPWRRRIVAESFTANCLGFVVRNWLQPEPRVPARLFTGRFESGSGETIELAFGSGDYRITSPRVGSPEFDRVLGVVAEAVATCRAQGIGFVFAFIPTKLRVYRDDCDFDPASPCRNWPLDDLSTAMQNAVERLGADVAYIDLTRRFQDEAADGSLVYLPDDTHWTSAGHEIAAEELARYCRMQARSASE